MLTAKELRNKVERLNTKWLAAEEIGRDFQRKAWKLEDQIAQLCHSVTKEVFDASGVGNEILCADWEDYQPGGCAQ